MKKPVEITLSTIHCGDARRVVTLGVDGKDLAGAFLTGLLHNDHHQFESIRTRIRAVSNYPRYENRTTFRHVGEQVFEFKRPGLRLYAFYDEIDGEHQLIICTSGGIKGKDQQTDIVRARALKAKYFSAKKEPGTIIKLD